MTGYEYERSIVNYRAMRSSTGSGSVVAHPYMTPSFQFCTDGPRHAQNRSLLGSFTAVEE
jgi:hypothetical protein